MTALTLAIMTFAASATVLTATLWVYREAAGLLDDALDEYDAARALLHAAEGRDA